MENQWQPFCLVLWLWMKVRIITITLSPALSLSAWKEIVFLFDKDGRWALTQEFTVCFFPSGHCYKTVGWRPNPRRQLSGRHSLEWACSHFVPFSPFFPLFFPRNTWPTATQAASSRPSGSATTWAPSQWSTQRGDSLCTGLSHRWVTLPSPSPFLCLPFRALLSLSCPEELSFCLRALRWGGDTAAHHWGAAGLGGDLIAGHKKKGN